MHPNFPFVLLSPENNVVSSNIFHSILDATVPSPQQPPGPEHFRTLQHRLDWLSCLRKPNPKSVSPPVFHLPTRCHFLLSCAPYFLGLTSFFFFFLISLLESNGVLNVKLDTSVPSATFPGTSGWGTFFFFLKYIL